MHLRCHRPLATQCHRLPPGLRRPPCKPLRPIPLLPRRLVRGLRGLLHQCNLGPGCTDVTFWGSISGTTRTWPTAVGRRRPTWRPAIGPAAGIAAGHTGCAASARSRSAAAARARSRDDPLSANAPPQRAGRIDDIRSQRQQTQEGGRTIIREPGRIIIQDPNGQSFIRHS